MTGTGCAQALFYQTNIVCYRGADKLLTRPERKQANVCQNSANFLRRFVLLETKLDDSSRLDVVEIARVPDMLPSLFPSWSG